MKQKSVETRCCTVAIVGLPNAGKSSLVNALVDFKIAPVHPKPQMTRRNLLGLVTESPHQIIFIDTPGFNRRDDVLVKRMTQDIRKALESADVLIFLWGKDQKDFQIFSEWITPLVGIKPSYLVINKNDLSSGDVAPVLELANQLRIQALFVSAKTKEGLEELMTVLKSEAKPSPYLYPEDDVSVASCREIAKAMLQESLMEYLGQEIPYQSTVQIEVYEETHDRHSIRANIIVNRDSQKGMVIGKGGATLKKIGQRTRLALEKNFGVKVYLETFVKVDANWIKNQSKVDEYSEG